MKKANKFKKLNNIEHFNNINELIMLKPDFIVIALPHFLRIEPILECCKNKINLLIEKPLVLNSNELSSIKKYISKKILPIQLVLFIDTEKKYLLLTN